MAKKNLLRGIHGYTYFILVVPIVSYFYFTKRIKTIETSSSLFMRLLDGESVGTELSYKANAYGTIFKILSIIHESDTKQLDPKELEIIHRNPHFKSSVAVATLGKLMGDYCKKRNSPWSKMINLLEVFSGAREPTLGEFPFCNPILIGSVQDIQEELIDGTSNKCTKDGTG